MIKQLKDAVEEIKYTLGIHCQLTKHEENDVAYVIAKYILAATLDSNFAKQLGDFCSTYESSLKK